MNVSNWPAGKTHEPHATRPSICRVMQAWYLASCARVRFQDRERPFLAWKNPSWLSNKSRLWSQFPMLKIDPSRTKSTHNHHICCRNCSWNWLLLTSNVKISKRMTGMLIRAPVISMAWGLGLWKVKNHTKVRKENTKPSNLVSSFDGTYPKMHLVLSMALLVPAYHMFLL